ncbi:CDP-diacylglycerol diphosphatase [Erwinia sp. OLTSP20]|uniref:CDP-diacylglycerol pyrophosphatase n=1 Tax=unclassified Erwinia TaxID=2622719 RepID=UPI000C1A06A4|nr:MULTISPECIES: CDP-diacylglycerol diphosphatase [unclassified Erwinia]PIJ49892.1 CDP-diacylglycerol diphosphatase [Erwinia sp. OAMSP11]PIJ71417.1 CDP-diacylglycerol diphosphatase [Erwinia sp. OLSSP12]PIJ80852.1 CDP-diacylglycerol diphosphatase [Erwinia sp. OLCASP19]PIJ83331.1 CDP-diacylglycerol diphosphatase [Erwinia sp. OLMTSP26]PIJ85553.1 CDP-diacylglycerol diphosphatase [Erwinia sp. OLMDSP33]
MTQIRKCCTVLLSVVILLAIGAGAYLALSLHSHAGALWRIISQQCIVNQQAHHNPAPCQLVDLNKGFVVMKDRHGPLQFLLLPAARIHGIESPQLLTASTNYFAEAWHARHYAQALYGRPLADRIFSLAVNSPWSRSQNQLHIHISCLQPEVRRRLDELTPRLSSRWQKEKLNQYEWLIRTVSRDEFNHKSPFLYLSEEVPGARQAMGHYGIAVAALNDGRWAMMVIERNLLTLNRASAEDIQDHRCALAYGNTHVPTVQE